VLLPSGTHRKVITSITVVLLPFTDLPRSSGAPLSTRILDDVSYTVLLLHGLAPLYLVRFVENGVVLLPSLTAQAVFLSYDVGIATRRGTSTGNGWVLL
jgi:hypothetical protein